MILMLSWKNVWRSKRRSIIIAAAIALGMWGGLFAAGVMQGMAETMVNSSIERQLTHLQIHLPGYREERSIEKMIPNADSVAAFARRLPGVYEATERTIVDGMVSSSVTSQGVSIIGVAPDAEAAATSLKKEIVQGTYFDPAKAGTILIGKKLAEKLEVKLRSKIVLTFQSPEGSIMYAAFRVAGVFETTASQYDAGTVYVSRADIFPLLGKPIVHEIGVRLVSEERTEATVDTLQKVFPSLEVKGWRDLAPELKITAESTAISMNIFLGIILLALLFGITNTMLMSVMDRIREFGMLMAVGMKRRQIFVLVMTETVLLSLTGGIAGLFVAAGTITYLHRTGIDLTMFSDGLSYYGISSMLYPTVPMTTYPLVTAMIFLTALVAAVYPAVKITQLHPVTAMRTYL